MKLSDMQKDPLAVHILSKNRANALIEQGLAKPAVIDPAPEHHVAVTLTSLGRSATESTPAKPETPVK